MMAGKIFELVNKVRQTACELHTAIRNSHLEKACENGLVDCHSKLGLSVIQQFPESVHKVFSLKSVVPSVNGWTGRASVRNGP